MSGKLAPRFWGAHLLALVLVAAAGALGLWQYGAWQAHRTAEAVDLTHADPMPLADVMGPDDPFPGNRVGQPVDVAGTWVPSGTVFVSGREHDGSDGYWMVTPLAVGGPDAPALPVVIGWTADPSDAPAPPTGQQRIVAWLQPTEGSDQVDDDPNDDVLPQVRTADLIQHVDQDLYGAYGVLDGATPGLDRAGLDQLPQASTFTGVRNLLYAIEWWFFGLFAAFIWWRWVTEKTPETHEAEDEAEPSPTAP